MEDFLLNLCDIQTQLSNHRRFGIPTDVTFYYPPCVHLSLARDEDSSPTTSSHVGGVESSALADLETSSVSPLDGAESSKPRTSMSGKLPTALPHASSATTVPAAPAPSDRILRSAALPSDPVPMAPPPPPEDYPPSPPPLPPVRPDIEYVFTGAPAPSPLSLLALRAFHKEKRKAPTLDRTLYGVRYNISGTPVYREYTELGGRVREFLGEPADPFSVRERGYEWACSSC